MSDISVDLWIIYVCKRCNDISVISETDLDDLGVFLNGFVPRMRSFLNAAQFCVCVCAAERDDCIWGIKLKLKAQRG